VRAYIQRGLDEGARLVTGELSRLHTSAPGLGPPSPQLRRDRVRPFIAAATFERPVSSMCETRERFDAHVHT
jgi:hypothetical protein